VTFCELPLWEICITRIVQAEEILIGWFVECQSIKNVGGRRSVEELYQALFFVSPVPPECFTERNENRAWSQVRKKRTQTPSPMSTTKHNGRLTYSSRDIFKFVGLWWGVSVTLGSRHHAANLSLASWTELSQSWSHLRMCLTGRGLGSRMVSNFKGFVGNRLGRWTFSSFSTSFLHI